MTTSKHFIILFIIIVIAVSLPSCKTTQGYVKETKSDTIFLSKTDYVRDSVFVDRYNNIYVSGDTVYNTERETIYKWKLWQVTDTVYKTNNEVKIEEKKVVEYRRNGYDRFVSWGFWILVALIVLVIAWKIFKKVYLRR